VCACWIGLFGGVCGSFAAAGILVGRDWEGGWDWVLNIYMLHVIVILEGCILCRMRRPSHGVGKGGFSGAFVYLSLLKANMEVDMRFTAR
jgi:hypothetical protein